MDALTGGPKQQGAPAGTAPGRVTIGWGRRDWVTVPRQAARAVELFPDAVLHWFERCGHFPQWDAPHQATDCSWTALTEVGAPPSRRRDLVAPGGSVYE